MILKSKNRRIREHCRKLIALINDWRENRYAGYDSLIMLVSDIETELHKIAEGKTP